MTGDRPRRSNAGRADPDQFDLPDAQIAMDDPSSAIACSTRSISTNSPSRHCSRPATPFGLTLNPSVERWPDQRHHRTSGQHNPLGIWRFLAQGESGLEAPEPALVSIPSLIATLAALDRQNGRPLAQEEVVELVDKSPCIAMERADARAVETSRGYADIEPELT